MTNPKLEIQLIPLACSDGRYRFLMSSCLVIGEGGLKINRVHGKSQINKIIDNQGCPNIRASMRGGRRLETRIITIKIIYL